MQKFRRNRINNPVINGRWGIHSKKIDKFIVGIKAVILLKQIQNKNNTFVNPILYKDRFFSHAAHTDYSILLWGEKLWQKASLQASKATIRGYDTHSFPSMAAAGEDFLDLPGPVGNFWVRRVICVGLGEISLSVR